MESQSSALRCVQEGRGDAHFLFLLHGVLWEKQRPSRAHGESLVAGDGVLAASRASAVLCLCR